MQKPAKKIIDKNTMLFLGVVIAFAFVITQLITIVMMPTEVYAPTSRRGSFQISFVGTIMENQNPFASPYMLVLCDTEQANAAYKDWKATT